VEYLIVGGGGAGAVRDGGAGGAGGLLSGIITVSPQNYSIVVGEGGVGVQSAIQIEGNNGQNSSAFGLTAIGGGGGGRYTQQGRTGGSGGGNGGNTSGLANGGLGTSEQGNNGGKATVGQFTGAGGGGAGGPGEDVVTNEIGSNGGPGLPSNISGTLQFYAGGGGGSGTTLAGLGGSGIGGNGTTGAGIAGSGQPNTGSGGGSARSSNGTGGSGGSGIVIIRYPGPQRATGGTVTTVGNDIVHTFTGNGTFTVLPAYTNNQAFDWVTDLSGNNKHGTPVNGPTFSTSNGGSFVFDGVNDYVNLGSTSNYFTTGSVSHSLAISIWVKSTVTDNHIFFGNQQITNERIYISKHENTWDIGWGEFSWSTANITSGSRKAATSNWTHLTMNVSAGVASLYVNGEFTFNRTDTSVNLTGNLPLAGYIFQGNLDTGNLKSTTISSCTIYNRALTAAEIQQNFQATRGRYGI